MSRWLSLTRHIFSWYEYLIHCLWLQITQCKAMTCVQSSSNIKSGVGKYPHWYTAVLKRPVVNLKNNFKSNLHITWCRDFLWIKIKIYDDAQANKHTLNWDSETRRWTEPRASRFPVENFDGGEDSVQFRNRKKHCFLAAAILLFIGKIIITW